MINVLGGRRNKVFDQDRLERELVESTVSAPLDSIVLGSVTVHVKSQILEHYDTLHIRIADLSEAKEGWFVPSLPLYMAIVHELYTRGDHSDDLIYHDEYTSVDTIIQRPSNTINHYCCSRNKIDRSASSPFINIAASNTLAQTEFGGELLGTGTYKYVVGQLNLGSPSDILTMRVLAYREDGQSKVNNLDYCPAVMLDTRIGVNVWSPRVMLVKEAGK